MPLFISFNTQTMNIKKEKTSLLCVSVRPSVPWRDSNTCLLSLRLMRCPLRHPTRAESTGYWFCYLTCFLCWLLLLLDSIILHICEKYIHWQKYHRKAFKQIVLWTRKSLFPVSTWIGEKQNKITRLVISNEAAVHYLCLILIVFIVLVKVAFN
jgi:hypothetical protein